MLFRSPSARTALIQLGLIMASVLENADVPVEIWNEISEMDLDIEDLLKPQHPYVREAARFRGIVMAYASVAEPV